MTKAEAIKNQIMAIRDSGVINMLDVRGVQAVAARLCFWTLVDFIEYDRNGYVNFIMSGNEMYLA